MRVSAKQKMRRMPFADRPGVSQVRDHETRHRGQSAFRRPAFHPRRASTPQWRARQPIQFPRLPSPKHPTTAAAVEPRRFHALAAWAISGLKIQGDHATVSALMVFTRVANMATSWDPREHYKDRRIAESYDRERFSSLAGRVFNRLEKRALLRALHSLPAGSSIVDIPCGTGRLAEPLLRAGYRVTGIDISQQMLDQASQTLVLYGSRFRSKLGDAAHLPPSEEAFAAAFCARVLMHFPLDEQIDFLRGVASQTDGLVVFNQSYDSRYQRTRHKLKGMLGHAGRATYPIAESDLQQLLEEVGLHEVRRVWVAPLVSEAFFVVATKK